MGHQNDTEIGIERTADSTELQRTAADNASMGKGEVSDSLYLDPVAERSYVRKLDRWLLPVLAIM